MAGPNGHITLKVILGYLLLVAMAVGSVVYIYDVIGKIAEEQTPDSLSRKKVYLVTNTLSLLYESEALGQLIGIGDACKYRSRESSKISSPWSLR